MEYHFQFGAIVNYYPYVHHPLLDCHTLFYDSLQSFQKNRLAHKVTFHEVQIWHNGFRLSFQKLVEHRQRLYGYSLQLTVPLENGQMTLSLPGKEGVFSSAKNGSGKGTPS